MRIEAKAVVALTTTNFRRALLVGLSMIALASCGGGNENGDANSSHPNSNLGWITTSRSSYTTGSSTASLSGNAFMSPEYAEYTQTRVAPAPEVTVSWRNETSGTDGYARQQVTLEFCFPTTTSADTCFWSHRWEASVPLVPGTNVITVMANDSSGNAASVTVTVTYHDVNSPTVRSTFPFTTECIRFETNGAVRVEFSETMDPTSISTSTVLLTDNLNNRVSGSVTYANLIATFTPISGLQASTTYTATVTTGVKDIAGNALATDYSWTFTTGMAPGVAPPTVYVRATTGADTNAGTLASPFKTITKALTIATVGMTVQVMPGTYDAANGETFPITVPAGVSLIGDEAGKGNPGGACQALVAGMGMFAGLRNWATAIEPTSSSVMSAITPVGIALNDAGVTVRNNTIAGSQIGILLWDGPGRHIITGNMIVGNWEAGLWIWATYHDSKVENNVIRGNGYGVRFYGTSVDLGGGSTGSAGGNAIYCNSWNDLSLFSAGNNATLNLANNFWDHAPLAGNDVDSPGGWILSTTGAQVVTALRLNACP